MARGYGTTYGTGANSDKITSSAAFALQTQSSISYWMFQHGAGSGSDGLAFGAGASPTVLANRLNGTATAWIFTAPWSSSRGQYNYTGPGSDNAWHHVLITYDGSSTANVPKVYIDGISKTVTTGTTPSGTYGLTLPAGAALSFGQSGGATGWDGMLAEFAVWNGALLTASEVTALAKGVMPLLVRPSQLSFYAPLNGTGSGEADWSPNHFTQTITATKPQPHAPVSFWMPPSPMAPVSAHFSGTLALTQGTSSTAIALKQKFGAAAAALQPASSTAIAQQEKFAGHLSLTAANNNTAIFGVEMVPMHPGQVAISDAMQGGLLAAHDQATGGLALADTGLYRVQISESV